MGTAAGLAKSYLELCGFFVLAGAQYRGPVPGLLALQVDLDRQAGSAAAAPTDTQAILSPASMPPQAAGP
jgi:hypothetical protein